MSTESESDEGEGDRKGMPQVGTGIDDATILGDEKQKSEVSGTDGASAKKSNNKKMSEGDAEPVEKEKLGANKATDVDASEEDMLTEMKGKKEKRELQEDGVESEQNDGIGASIELKKQYNSSISTSGVQVSL
ncbi:hypothetical protein MKW92_047274 [Papaver armeniacum]|nr:hypothetical protein MKW92_047274 [Papaver armeniacum]